MKRTTPVSFSKQKELQVSIDKICILIQKCILIQTEIYGNEVL